MKICAEKYLLDEIGQTKINKTFILKKEIHGENVFLCAKSTGKDVTKNLKKAGMGVRVSFLRLFKKPSYQRKVPVTKSFGQNLLTVY
jgi:hypothetical protein